MTDSTQPRLCMNCACHLIQENTQNPLEKQFFCRRDTPMAQQMRVERPVIRDGRPVMNKSNGKPMTEAGVEIIYLYKPTLANLVCFDGWRPMEYQPGERMAAILKEDITELMSEGYRRLMADIQSDELSKIEVCAHGKALGIPCGYCHGGIAKPLANG